VEEAAQWTPSGVPYLDFREGQMSRHVLVGAGGHAKVVLEVFRALGGFDVVGFVDPNPPAPVLLGLPVLGGDAMLHDLRAQGVESGAGISGVIRTFPSK
jgi:FlaA1/EpsC-like NDP-sugar epimerase